MREQPGGREGLAAGPLLRACLRAALPDAPCGPATMGFKLDKTELGAGGYGKVVVARDEVTGEAVAAKLIATSRMKAAAIQKEVDLMRLFNHKYIIGLKAEPAQEGKYYIIYMELATGGELFSRVISSGSLTEADARPYFRQLMEAVEEMHSKGVVHRDLKLENVLLDGSGNCKVCDFGLAHRFLAGADGSKFDASVKLKEVCGSKSYCAPEVLEGRGYLGFPTDVWSCGICLFAMLAGFFPLDEASGGDWRYERVKTAAAAGQSTCHTIYGFYERPCLLSKEVTDLIDAMLAINPEKRLTVAQVLQAPWLAVGLPLGGGVYDGEAQPPSYRGVQMGPEQLKALLAQESAEPVPPVYRGVAAAPPSGAPMLGRQTAFLRGDEAPH